MTNALKTWQAAIREVGSIDTKVHDTFRDRQEFESWLQEVHLLDATWNEKRNCYDEFPAHLAFRAWLAAKDGWVIPKSPVKNSDGTIRQF